MVYVVCRLYTSSSVVYTGKGKLTMYVIHR